MGFRNIILRMDVVHVVSGSSPLEGVDNDAGVSLQRLDVQPISGLATILRMPAAQLPELIRTAHANPDVANMCMQMFYVLMALGKNDFAIEMQRRALHIRSVYRIAGTRTPAIRLLALMGPGDMLENTPIEFLLENSDVSLDILYFQPDEPLPETIPDHDIAIVALGESEKNLPLLQLLDALSVRWPKPLLNAPRCILRCARDSVYALLSDIPALIVPRTERVAGGSVKPPRFPFTIRPIDTHAGHGLMKFDAGGSLEQYFRDFPSQAYYLSEYVDYQSEDGCFRKLRIALIDGVPYLCHLAISEQWMVHYVSAEMELSAQKRAEEAMLMSHFGETFGVRHASALQAIYQRIGLDYVVMDCAETRSGELLLFEVDSRALVHATDPVDVFPYKPQVMTKAFNAFRSMLRNRLNLL